MFLVAILLVSALLCGCSAASVDAAPSLGADAGATQVDSSTPDAAGLDARIPESGAGDASDGAVLGPSTCVARAPTPAATCSGSLDCPFGTLCCSSYNKGLGRPEPASCLDTCNGAYPTQHCTEACECPTGRCEGGKCR